MTKWFYVPLLQILTFKKVWAIEDKLLIHENKLFHEKKNDTDGW